MDEDENLAWGALMLEKKAAHDAARAAGIAPTAAQVRRAAEQRPLEITDRRRIRRTNRTVAINIKTTPEMKRRLISYCDRSGFLLVEFIERAIDHYAKHLKY